VVIKLVTIWRYHPRSTAKVLEFTDHDYLKKYIL